MHPTPLATRLTVWSASAVLAVCLVVGALGALLGGRASDVGQGPGGLVGAPSLLLLAISVGLGLPAAVLAARRREWRTAGLLAVGPAVFGFGYFFVPHAVDPCTVGLLDLGSMVGDQFLCEHAAGALSVDVRFHLLEHAAVTAAVFVPWASLVLGVRLRAATVLAVAAGLAWAVYGALELMQPFGPDTRYDGAYDVVVDPTLHVLYSSPGSVALLLSAAVLLAVVRRLDVGTRGVLVLTGGAAALGLLSAAGVATGVDPVFTGARVAGTLLLGVAVLAAARRAAGQERTALLGLGALGVLLLPLWPLVFAVQWLTPGAAAAVIALHGLGWALLGSLAGRRPAPAALPTVAEPAYA